MNKICAAVTAALAMASASALAHNSGSVQLSDFHVNVYDLSGQASNASTVSFTGLSVARTDITSKNVLGPSTSGYLEPVIYGATAFGSVMAMSHLQPYSGINVSPSASPAAYFSGIDGSGSFVSADGDESGVGYIRSTASLSLGGDSFQLAPFSELVISGDVLLQASGGSAFAFVGFDGQAPALSAGEGAGSLSSSFYAIFVNNTNAIETGRLSATFSASSIPEPAPVLLITIGLLGVISVKRHGLRTLGVWPHCRSSKQERFSLLP